MPTSLLLRRAIRNVVFNAADYQPGAPALLKRVASDLVATGLLRRLGELMADPAFYRQPKAAEASLTATEPLCQGLT